MDKKPKGHEGFESTLIIEARGGGGGGVKRNKGAETEKRCSCNLQRNLLVSGF